MMNLVNDHTARSVTESGAERPCQAQWNTPASLLTALLVAAPSLLATTEALAIGETTRVNENAWGRQARDFSFYPALSADGRFVAFVSRAMNLVYGDSNGTYDVFVHDRQAHHIIRVSVDSAGNQGNGDSSYPSISADGRFVAFHSSSSNLVPGDTNDADDLFVHDRQTHQTTRVSVDSAGTQGNGFTFPGNAISATGRFVAFASSADNLVADDTNSAVDVFVHDLQTHRTARVSVNSDGIQGISDPDIPGSGSEQPTISADGRFVGFSSWGINLVPDDTNRAVDVFVHDRQTHQTARISIDSAGNQGNSESLNPEISADGRFVAFHSSSRNLVSGDTNGQWDVFVHDRQAHQTTRVSVDSAGNQANYPLIVVPGIPRLSADGRFVAFDSRATNLVPDDTKHGFGDDVFVHDRRTHLTTRVSANSTGDQADSDSGTPAISADGRLVAFASKATNLVVGDTNGQWDIFVRDRLLDRTATADLGITQTAEPAQFVPLTPLTYTLTAVNHGPDAATDVTVKDSPALLSGTVLSVTPSQGSCSQGAPFVCYLGTLAPGASSTITVSLQPRWRNTVSLWNTAQVSAAPVDGNRTNNQSTLRTDVAP